MSEELFRLYGGDCRAVLKTFPGNSVDSVVTDPPYELGFMGKSWDEAGVIYDPATWREVLRVLKPGGHLLAFGGTRTSHRMVCAIEDAGFAIRDSIHWLYGTGFPKSLNVSKAIEAGGGPESIRRLAMGADYIPSGRGRVNYDHGGGSVMNGTAEFEIRTDAAKQWEGWGTALKPAHEPIVMARKPLIGTVAVNVLEYGTGALNIDGCRISGGSNSEIDRSMTAGRWPANVMLTCCGEDPHLDGCPVAELPSRFFYVTKASRSERNLGCEALICTRQNGARNNHPTVKPLALMRELVRLVTPPGKMVLDPFLGSGTTGMAALSEGMYFLGIELMPEYISIAEARIRHIEQSV